MSLDGQVPWTPPRAPPLSFQDSLHYFPLPSMFRVLSPGGRRLLVQVLAGLEGVEVAGNVQMAMGLDLEQEAAGEEEEDEEDVDEEDGRIPLDPVDVNLLSNEDNDDDDDDTTAAATPPELELPDGRYRFEPYINIDPEQRTHSWDPYAALHPPFADEGVDINPGILARVPLTSEFISMQTQFNGYNDNAPASSTSRGMMSIPLYQHPDNFIPPYLDIFAFQG